MHPVSRCFAVTVLCGTGKRRWKRRRKIRVSTADLKSTSLCQGQGESHTEICKKQLTSLVVGHSQASGGGPGASADLQGQHFNRKSGHRVHAAEDKLGLPGSLCNPLHVARRAMELVLLLLLHLFCASYSLPNSNLKPYKKRHSGNVIPGLTKLTTE